MDEEGHTASVDQQTAFATTREDRDSTLAAIHRLEAAAGMAAPGREREWLERVLTELRSLEQTVAGEGAESARPDSLLSMIARDYPRRFGSRVRQLREQHEDIARTISSLCDQLESLEGEPVDFVDVRQRLEWLVRVLRHGRARESDLVYEAIRLDLGHGTD
jgi:hypothetical protein